MKITVEIEDKLLNAKNRLNLDMDELEDYLDVVTSAKTTEEVKKFLVKKIGLDEGRVDQFLGEVL